MKKALFFITMVFLSGCFQSEENSVKIIDGQPLAPFNQEIVNDIQQFYNQKGEDWKDENTILVSRPNPHLSVHSVNDDGSKSPFFNLYEYHLVSKKSKEVFAERFNQINASYSRNKEYLFYHRQRNVDLNTKGMIIDLHQHKVRPVFPDDIEQSMGQWTQQQRILFSPFLKNEIYEANVFGKSKRLTDQLPFAIEQVAKIGEDFYIVGLDEKLYRMQGEKLTVIKENVASFAVSRDEKKLVLRLSKPDHRDHEALMMIDRNGRTLLPLISKGGIIEEVCWSPDQTKIAYSVSSEQEKKNGLFIFDVKGKKNIKVMIDQNPFMHLKWSPSGKKLMVTNTTEKNGKFVFINHIIAFRIYT